MDHPTRRARPGAEDSSLGPRLPTRRPFPDVGSPERTAFVTWTLRPTSSRVTVAVARFGYARHRPLVRSRRAVRGHLGRVRSCLPQLPDGEFLPPMQLNRRRAIGADTNRTRASRHRELIIGRTAHPDGGNQRTVEARRAVAATYRDECRPGLLVRARIFPPFRHATRRQKRPAI